MKNILLIGFGAVLGAAGTYFYLNAKYDARLLSEIEQVKAVYAPEEPEPPAPEESEEDEISKIRDKVSYDTEAMAKYLEVVQKNYSNASEEPVQIADPAPEMPNDPLFQIITKLEYDTRDQFETAELTYYTRSDVLATEVGEEVDVVEYLGPDAKTYFGGKNPVTVYVLNRAHGCKYMVTENNEVEVI